MRHCTVASLFTLLLVPALAAASGPGAGMASDAILAHGPTQGVPAFAGQWTLLPLKSSQVDLFGTLALDIQGHGPKVTLEQMWGRGQYAFNTAMTLTTDGTVNEVPVTDRVWPTEPFMGVSMKVGTKQRVTATWSDDGRTLVVVRHYTVLVSQGTREVTSTDTYRLGASDDQLTLDITRPTRLGG
ncbi:MAG: hypothetical protein P8174_00795, partial [Gemmatimonadota bacterium]